MLVTEQVLIPGLFITLILMVAKPFFFKWSFRTVGEPEKLSSELGVRLGQASEFGLPVGYSAITSELIEPKASYLIQTVVVLTFVLSTYWVIYRYPTPISANVRQRQD